MANTGTAPRIRRWWTESEDKILRREANLQLQEGGIKDWSCIAAQLPRRTNKDCRKRWSKVCNQVNKGVWSTDEDERLEAAIGTYGNRWTRVAAVVGTRHADQCAKRWQHSLDPGLDHGKWAAGDDNRLLAAVATLGRNWKAIRDRKFPNRSATDIKNRYEMLDRRRQLSARSSLQSLASTSCPGTQGNEGETVDGADGPSQNLDQSPASHIEDDDSSIGADFRYGSQWGDVAHASLLEANKLQPALPTASNGGLTLKAASTKLSRPFTHFDSTYEAPSTADACGLSTDLPIFDSTPSAWSSLSAFDVDLQVSDISTSAFNGHSLLADSPSLARDSVGGSPWSWPDTAAPSQPAGAASAKRALTVAPDDSRNDLNLIASTNPAAYESIPQQLSLDALPGLSRTDPAPHWQQDMSPACSSLPESSTTSDVPPVKTILVLEDVQSETINTVVATLLASRQAVKMRLFTDPRL